MNKIITGVTNADLGLKATAGAELPIAPACSPCASEPGARCCGTGECWTCPLGAQRPTAWPNVSALVSEYVEGYELRGDGDYAPNDGERLMIEDAIHGLLVDDAFLLALDAARAATAPADTLSDAELDALDTFSLAHLAPRQRESVRSYGRAVIAALAVRQARDRIPPTVAECIATLDLWADRLEKAIDCAAQHHLGQHPNDEPAGFQPLEQLP